jgi:hypothetical protein
MERVPQFRSAVGIRRAEGLGRGRRPGAARSGPGGRGSPTPAGNHEGLPQPAPANSFRFPGGDLCRPPGDRPGVRRIHVERQGPHNRRLHAAHRLRRRALGRFWIELRWKSLRPLRLGCYHVVAREPNPAGTDESVTHPHVQDEFLCEGEAQESIHRALSQGRLLDFFVLVRCVLETYNSASPYVPIEDWGGIRCGDCDAHVPRDEVSRCCACSTRLCGECCSLCSGCDDDYCSECISRCAACDERCCSGCLSACTRCGKSICNDCLQPNGRCENCDDEDKTKMASPTLRFSPTAWAKLLYLRDLGDTEVGGFGVAAEDDLLYVEDFVLVKQSCTPVSVCFEDESVADYFDAQADLGRPPERCARIWLHTHPGRSPRPARPTRRRSPACSGSANGR